MLSYAEHLKKFKDSESISFKAKDALRHLDEMDCVKALNYAHTFVQMLEKKVKEAEGK